MLNILEYSETNDSLWSVKFSINRAYEILFKLLKEISVKS